MHYRIVRKYQNGHKRTIFTTNSLEVAQKHCRDPETSSRTCRLHAGIRRTQHYGEWFDVYYECKR